jgi:ribonuclease P/MRP protein subunit RPP1
MRKFVDLHLLASTDNLKQLEKMVTKSAELEYHMLGIPLPKNVQQEKIHQITDICDKAGVEFIQRVDLTPRTSNELLNALGHFRRKSEIISVACISKVVARQAAKDRRVDLLSTYLTFPSKHFFDYAEAELASEKSAALEINITQILSSSGFARIRLLSSLRKEVAIARKFKVPIVISSGASDENLLRSPHDYVALATLFDMPTPLAIQALSDTPLSIVERNRQKLSPNYVAPGLRVVEK